jgi:signal transduction histidine kinase
MDYSPLIAAVPLPSGKVISGILIVIAGLIVVAVVAVAIWKKLTENETLKREFITIVAHKFRTPLTQERWLAEGLLAEEQNAYRRETLVEMQKVNKHLIALTGTLIELTESDSAEKTSYTFKRESLCPLVRSVGESLRNSFKEKNIFFAVQCPPEEVFVKIDAPRLEFVLQTIFNNAIIYTPPGRNVDVAVSHGGGKAVVMVTDHGIGIARDDLPHIFTKFYRTENAQRTDTEGFGVGLYLSQSIVKKHKGKLEVYSEGIDKGTTFTITLPAVR